MNNFCALCLLHFDNKLLQNINRCCAAKICKICNKQRNKTIQSKRKGKNCKFICTYCKTTGYVYINRFFYKIVHNSGTFSYEWFGGNKRYRIDDKPSLIKLYIKCGSIFLMHWQKYQNLCLNNNEGSMQRESNKPNYITFADNKHISSLMCIDGDSICIDINFHYNGNIENKYWLKDNHMCSTEELCIVNNKDSTLNFSESEF